MKAVVAAAKAAKRELSHRPLPSKRPKTQALASEIGVVLRLRGLVNFDEPFWRKVLAQLNEKIDCAADIYFWVCGVGHYAAELAVNHPSGNTESHTSVNESERVNMIVRICDAIIEADQKSAKKKR